MLQPDVQVPERKGPVMLAVLPQELPVLLQRVLPPASWLPASWLLPFLQLAF
jgi:hypothetical protein